MRMGASQEARGMAGRFGYIRAIGGFNGFSVPSKNSVDTVGGTR
jgi:hypothetical protein